MSWTSQGRTFSTLRYGEDEILSLAGVRRLLRALDQRLKTSSLCGRIGTSSSSPKERRLSIMTTKGGHVGNKNSFI